MISGNEKVWLFNVLALNRFRGSHWNAVGRKEDCEMMVLPAHFAVQRKELLADLSSWTGMLSQWTTMSDETVQSIRTYNTKACGPWYDWRLHKYLGHWGPWFKVVHHRLLRPKAKRCRLQSAVACNRRCQACLFSWSLWNLDPRNLLWYGWHNFSIWDVICHCEYVLYTYISDVFGCLFYAPTGKLWIQIGIPSSDPSQVDLSVRTDSTGNLGCLRSVVLPLLPKWLEDIWTDSHCIHPN